MLPTLTRLDIPAKEFVQVASVAACANIQHIDLKLDENDHDAVFASLVAVLRKVATLKSATVRLEQSSVLRKFQALPAWSEFLKLPIGSFAFGCVTRDPDSAFSCLRSLPFTELSAHAHAGSLQQSSACQLLPSLFPGLARLQLTNWHVSIDALQALSVLPLTDLELFSSTFSSGSLLTGKGLVAIALCPLRRLALHRLSQVSDADAKLCFSRLSQLHRLYVCLCDSSMDGNLQHLASLRTLTGLTWENNDDCSVALPAILQMRSLRSLTVNFVPHRPIAGSPLAQMAKTLTGLRELVVRATLDQFAPTDLQALAQLPVLEDVQFSVNGRNDLAPVLSVCTTSGAFPALLRFCLYDLRDSIAFRVNAVNPQLLSKAKAANASRPVPIHMFLRTFNRMATDVTIL